MRSASPWILALSTVLSAACGDVGSVTVDAGATQATPPPDSVPFSPPAPVLRRLTQAQYANVVHDVLGDGVVLAQRMEPDVTLDGSTSVGAATTSISARGVEQYESIAYDVARQLLGAGPLRAAATPCTPAGPTDDACAERFVRQTGLHLWRRPVTDDEAHTLVTVANASATALNDFYAGLQFALSAMLQSPNFLFRTELGDGAAMGPTAQFSPYPLASRLAFFLWNGPPDDALLAAAADGSLATDAGLQAQVDRMLLSPKLNRGLRAFVTEWLSLQNLDAVSKDAVVFPSFSADTPLAAREETLSLAEHLALTTDADFRDIVTTRQTFLNRRLASIYNVRAPAATRADGFGLATLPDTSPRRGILGHVSILSQFAHPTTSSPTLRGKFVRSALLCNQIPMPPVNVNTALPVISPTVRTMRDRLIQHQANPTCRACHALLDPIGLGLEHFDGIGRYRSVDNGAAIDASGNLDGAPFSDSASLAQVIHDDVSFPRCITTRLYRFAYGRTEGDGEEAEISRLTQAFAYRGYRLRALMSTIATSTAFRRADGATGSHP